MRKDTQFGLVALILTALLTWLPARGQAAAQSNQPPGSHAGTLAQPAPTAPPSSSPLAPALQVKRLILKDGSYQPVSKIEVQGDRVRYLSAERYEWEEIPYSFVDWKATEQYAREGDTKRQADVEAADAEEQAERKKEDELTALVAPGLRLPATGGVFLLDVHNHQAQLNELAQNGGEIKRNTGRNVLRATINPLAGQKQSVELQGQHARIQSHVGDPYIFVNVDEESSTASPAKDSLNRFRIVRAESVPKKDVRVVGNIKIAVYGKVSQQESFMATKAEVLSGPWLKITPAQPLEAGEYALVEVLDDNQLNLFVWDFGVNPNAPENPDVWRSGK